MPDNVPLVTADLDRIVQVMLNLLSNAVNFSPSGSGRVVVRVDPSFALDLHLDTDEANAAGLERHPVVTFAGIERRTSS